MNMEKNKSPGTDGFSAEYPRGFDGDVCQVPTRGITAL
jgi:hypothetical protein